MDEVEFAEKTRVEAERRGIRKNLPMLITEWEDIKPSLGMDWLREFMRAIPNIQATTTITDQSEEGEINTSFEKPLKTNGTNQDAEVKIQL